MPIARTTAGDVEGFEQDGVVHFRGVPFAAPPVGELRFAPPQPPGPWDGHARRHEIRPDLPADCDAARGSSSAVMEADQVMDEDCLYLNVTTPVPRRTRDR